MHDVIVVGGSYAGISAALQLARARRTVLVIDAGLRRNRFATASYGFLGQEGREPGEIAASARRELLAYPTVTWLEGATCEAFNRADGFAVQLASGALYAGKRLILASGVVDELPAIPGVAERWGTRIFYCPYCHGFELDRGRIAVLATMPISINPALMLPDWGTTTYFTRGLFEPDSAQRAALVRRDVAIESGAVTEVAGESTVDVRLADGRVLCFDGLFLLPKSRIENPIVAQLGCELEAGPYGAFIKTDQTNETSVPGVFACGDTAVGAGAVAIAVGDGLRAGKAAHRSLVFR